MRTDLFVTFASPSPALTALRQRRQSPEERGGSHLGLSFRVNASAASTVLNSAFPSTALVSRASCGCVDTTWCAQKGLAHFPASATNTVRPSADALRLSGNPGRLLSTTCDERQEPEQTRASGVGK